MAEFVERMIGVYCGWVGDEGEKERKKEKGGRDDGNFLLD